jgi:phytanoyl-CoA dioxygenase PhyH
MLGRPLTGWRNMQRRLNARRIPRYVRRALHRDHTTSSERALAECERLVADGKFSDAIGVLTDANRAQRDRALERRLAELRHEAFVQSAPAVSRVDWSEAVADQFPGAHIPEVDRAQFTADAVRSAITNHGSLLVRRLLDATAVRRLVGAIDASLDAYDARESGADRPELEGWFEPYKYDTTSDRPLKRSRGAVLAVDSPPALFDLIETFEAAGIGRVAHEYFGEAPTLLAKKVTLRRVAPEGLPGGWHQDGSFMGQGIRSLNVWVALTHCGDTAPGLDVAGQRIGELVKMGDGAYAAWGIKDEDAEAAAGGAIVRPVFEAGDALVFDHLCLHRTAIAPGMEHDRHAVETWFFAPSTYGEMTNAGGAPYTPRDQLPILY